MKMTATRKVHDRKQHKEIKARDSIIAQREISTRDRTVNIENTITLQSVKAK